MSNVTVSLDPDTYRNARVAAAERGTSVSALVREYLRQLGSAESETQRLKRQEREFRERITTFRGGDRLSRDDMYRRDA